MQVPQSDASVSGRGGSVGTPRIFLVILGWCLWLLGAWAVTLLSDGPTAAGRWMIFAAGMGLVLIWPAWRLSLEIPAQPGGRMWQVIGGVLAEWLALNLVLQTVIWVLPLSSGWSLWQTLWLDAALASWSLLIAAVVSWGCLGTGAWARAGAMLVCLVILFGGSVLQAGGWAGSGSAGSYREALNFWSLLYGLTQQVPSFQVGSYPWIVAGVAAVGTGFWLTLSLWLLIRRCRAGAGKA